MDFFLYFLVIYFVQSGKLFFVMTNSSRPQNLEAIYEALANAGDVGWEDNRSDENKVHTI